jgi:uncharacterized Zn finger protein (UPF0148 family)
MPKKIQHFHCTNCGFRWGSRDGCHICFNCSAEYPVTEEQTPEQQDQAYRNNPAAFQYPYPEVQP